MPRELSDMRSPFATHMIFPTSLTGMIATVTSPTMFADTGAEARHQLADTRGLICPARYGTRAAFFEKVVLSTRPVELIAMMPMSTMLRVTGAEARRHFADAYELTCLARLATCST